MSNTSEQPSNEPMTVAVILDVVIGHSVCPADETDENCKLALATNQINVLIERKADEAVSHALKSLKSIEYPPSGKEYHFTDGSWTNSLTGAVTALKDNPSNKGGE